MKILFSILMLQFSFALNAQGLSQNARGNKFNPSIGLSALTLFKNNNADSHSDGFSLQEIELQLSSDVDAYFRAEATLAFHPKEEDESEEDEHAHGFNVEPEEVFVETLATSGYTIKIGKFYSQFGKYNAFHTHALPFIYRSKIQNEMFGEEGLAQTGIGISLLIPVGWFSELTFEATQPTNEELFSDAHRSLAYNFKVKNLWDLSDALTLEWGLSGLGHKNHDHGAMEDSLAMLGTDFTFKWRPTQNGKSASLLWSTEMISKNKTGESSKNNWGVTSFIRKQFSQRWYLQGQYELLDEKISTDNSYAYSALLGFIPTEFSAIRLQYDHLDEDQVIKRISLQLNISIGAHPAHVY